VDPIYASPERCDIDRWESFGKTSGCFRPGSKATDVVKNKEERERERDKGAELSSIIIVAFAYDWSLSSLREVGLWWVCCDPVPLGPIRFVLT
jgi:hypothetical protein